jgi:CHAT domain-containing protein/Tfp pilus assembly protein PilF
MPMKSSNGARKRFDDLIGFRLSKVLALMGLMVLLSARPFPVANAAQQATTLTPGIVLEREIAGGEKHNYSLAVAGGEYIHVNVQQRGVNLNVRLIGPDGRLADSDSQRDTADKEHVYMLTESPGTASLEVSSSLKDDNKIRYVLTVQDWRPATQQDRDRLSARSLHQEGLTLERKGTPEARRQAIDKIKEAHGLYLRADLPSNAAGMLHDLAAVYTRLGELNLSIEALNESIPLCRAAGNLRCESVAYNYIGTHYQEYAGDYRKAMNALVRALELVRAEGNKRSEAVALNNVATVYFLMGEYQNASDYYHQSLLLRRESLDRTGESTSLNNIGGTYRELGEYQKALEYYDLSLGIARELKDRIHEARMLNNIGSVHSDSGDYPKALDYFNQALAIRREVKERRGEATTLNNIAGVYREQGEDRKALEYYKQALALRREVRDRRGELTTLVYIGRSLEKLDELSSALEYLNLALPISRAMGARNDEAAALHGLAAVEKKRGNLPGAQNHIEGALEIIESLRQDVASADLRASYLASKQHYYEFYIDLLMNLPQGESGANSVGAALMVNERARGRSLRELLIESRTDIREGVDPALIEQSRTIQARLNNKSARYGQLPDNPANAAQATALRAEIASLIEEYRRVEAQIRVQSPRYASLIHPPALTLDEIRQQVLDPQSLLLEYRLGKERSYLWVVSDTACQSFALPRAEHIQAAARRFYELITAPSKSVNAGASESTGSRTSSFASNYQRVARELSQMLLGPVADQLGRKRLLIVADGALEYIPFAALPAPGIQGRRPEPDGRERAGSRLRTPDQAPLIANHEIVNLPSASVLALIRRELKGRKPAPKALAVLADPVFGSDDARVAANAGQVKAQGSLAQRGEVQRNNAAPSELQRSLRESGLGGFVRLRFSRQEADTIASFLQENDRLKALDFKASRATALGESLGQYRILHFATHGLLNSQHPELSGLVFSLIDEQGNPQDGFLRFHDIYNLKLNADLVVLSACQTALGKEVRGEGLIGLTRGFMYAGAPRVVASLWRVDDRATAELMKRFYRGILQERLRPAAALRAAQVSMRGELRWSAPQYWAAFTLQGEWR